MGLKFPKVVGYQLIEQIGGGGFSTVFRAVNFLEHRVAACKFIALTPTASQKDRKTIEKEMRVHTVLKHVHVLEFINAVVVEPVPAQEHYHPGIYMLLELAAGGDLFDKIAPDIGVGEEVTHYYLTQLVSGICYIHEQGVCHRDLKPENLLLDAAGTLKISDFGLCAVFRLKESGRTRSLTERCGSLPYVAPELDGSYPYDAEPIDAWGVGVILFTLLAGNTPWDEPTARSGEYRRYLSGHIFNEEPWNRIPEGPLALITGLLAVDPAKRMTLAEVHEHPWFVRPSQIANRGVQALAEELTEPLRRSGDLGVAAPDFRGNTGHAQDTDGDQMMLSPQQSQFTQSLLLFSQTQSGTRYTPHLTRFYASLAPPLLMGLLEESLAGLNVRSKLAPPPASESSETGSSSASALPTAKLRLRVGGYDRRKLPFKGWIELEPFTGAGAGVSASFCVMARDTGNPISWRQLWKTLIKSPLIEPHVLRK